MEKGQPKSTNDKDYGCRRRDFLKIPGLTMGILFGSVLLPPWLHVAFSSADEPPSKIKGFVKVGIRTFTFPLPAFVIEKMVSSSLKRARKKVVSFSRLKRQIHHWVVSELPGRQAPIFIPEIADHFGLDVRTAESIVEELEGDKTFLFRHNSEGINWGYPVTVEPTPHHITFSTGETVYAA
jgi:hypothetical protein